MKNQHINVLETKQEIQVKKISCDTCGVTFALEKALKAHALIFHRNFKNLKESNKPNNAEDTSEGLNVIITDDFVFEREIDTQEKKETILDYLDLPIKVSSNQIENQTDKIKEDISPLPLNYDANLRSFESDIIKTEYFENVLMENYEMSKPKENSTSQQGQKFDCFYCPNSYESKETLTFHLLECGSRLNILEEFKNIFNSCTNCGTKFSRYDNLQRHVTTCQSKKETKKFQMLPMPLSKEICS